MCFRSSRTRLIIFSCAIFLTGCGGGTGVKIPGIVTNEITAIEPVECGAEPKADKVHMRKVEPWVVTDKADITWIGITPQDYENLSANIQTMLVQLRQRKAQVEWWRDCIEAHNERAAQFGKEEGAISADEKERRPERHDPPAGVGTMGTPKPEDVDSEG